MFLIFRCIRLGDYLPKYIKRGEASWIRLQDKKHHKRSLQTCSELSLRYCPHRAEVPKSWKFELMVNSMNGCLVNGTSARREWSDSGADLTRFKTSLPDVS